MFQRTTAVPQRFDTDRQRYRSAAASRAVLTAKALTAKSAAHMLRKAQRARRAIASE